MKNKRKVKEERLEKNKNKINEENIDDIINAINKKYGEGSLIKLGDIKNINEECIPTGALSLDLALGVGGIPKGRVIEIFGAEASGKSTLALSIVKQCQKMGGKAAYIDVENSMSLEYAKNIGIDVANLLFSQPISAEQGLGIMKDLVKSNKIGVIVIDSLAALAPQQEIDGEVGDQHMALQARLMSQTLRDVNGFIAKSKTVVIFINQLRATFNGGYGKPEDTPGGKALKFYSTIRMEVKKVEAIKDNNGIHIGNKVKVKVVKNKASAPMREAYFEIIFGRGIRKISAIFEAALSVGVIIKEGNTFYYNNNKLGIGENKTKEILKNNKELLAKIEEETKIVYYKKQEEQLTKIDDNGNDLNNEYIKDIEILE